MLQITQILADNIAARARAHYEEIYPGQASAPLEFALRVTQAALSALGRSDALYHNCEHTTHVTLVGLEVLKAKQQRERTLSPTQWANVICALLCHDVGYVRDLCQGDAGTRVVTGIPGEEPVDISGHSDAALMPLHINRGKLYVQENFADDPAADLDLLLACMERTRFPVPDDPVYHLTDDLPGLVRGADLIGQLSDPRYLQKLSAVFYEFEEIGFNAVTGYARPGDLLHAYPGFFNSSVEPYIDAAVALLEHTDEGRDVLKHLFGNLDHAKAALATSAS
jgi:hypothetical protein